MNPEDIREVNRCRLEEWEQILNEAGATPMCLIAAGQRGDALGTLHVFTPDGLEPKLMLNAMLFAAERFAAANGLMMAMHPMPTK